MLSKVDPEVDKILKAEEKRQSEVLEMIPSENYASKEVREALASVFTNKYAEGYPRKRYYQGNKYSDEIETLAIERAKKLFGTPHANVQPYSGSPANSAVMFALLDPGNKIMGLALASGGHLTHGHPNITFSGRYFKSVQYAVEPSGFIDYDKLEKQVKKEKPKLLICGTTAYPRRLDFGRFGGIADSVGAYLLADISHIVGLVVAGVHESPVPYADVIMTTTHKTLRGPRGAVLLVTDKGLKRDAAMGDKIDQAVFPALQGGPHLNTIAAMAVSFKEALDPEFKKYATQVVLNASVLADVLRENGVKMVSDGTDNHLILIDLIDKKLMGNVVALALEIAGIVTNKNAVPGDPLPPFYSSGIRLGTPAITTRGMKEKEMKQIGMWVAEVINLVEPYKNIKHLESKEARQEYSKKEQEKLRENRKLNKIASDVKRLTSHYSYDPNNGK